MSCFCASNSSGDSIYSGYFRWRMGLPLPPIPQEEETNILINTNKEIFSEIVGVKNLNGSTTDNGEVEIVSRKIRRRKNNQSANGATDRLLASSSKAKHVRENPIYINAVSQTPIATEVASSINSSFLFCPIRDEIFVPSKSESFFDNFSQIDDNYYNTKFSSVDESISTFLVNKFLSNIQQYSESLPVDSCTQETDQLANDNSDFNALEHKINSIISTVTTTGELLPPAVPPHRKPSIIMEESDSEFGTVKSGLENIDQECMDTLEPLRNQTEKTTTPIPIYSIKHGDIDKIISEGMCDYDYAYNKSWSKGVELNFSMNLTENRKSRKKRIAANKTPVVKDESADILKEELIVEKLNKEENSNKVVSDELGASITCLTNETDESYQVNSLPQTSPIPFLKLSSIEADALKQSPTKLSRNRQLSGSLAESETDSRSEPWDVIHGRFVKELTGARFIDLSVINNNKQTAIKIASTDDSKGTVNNNQRNNTVVGIVESKKSRESLRKLHANINSAVPLEKQPWYHFYLTRSRSETMLANHQNGSFLVRRSESNKNDYSLTIKHRGLFLHMKIRKTDKGFVLGEYSQPYQSIPHMLYHYCLTMVPVKGAEAACLKFPVTRDHN